jgi:hypothetical protein
MTQKRDPWPPVRSTASRRMRIWLTGERILDLLLQAAVSDKTSFVSEVPTGTRGAGLKRSHSCECNKELIALLAWASSQDARNPSFVKRSSW